MNQHIQVTCSVGNLPVIRDFVKTQLHALDVKGRVSNQVVLAVDEACANCIIHHHKCDNQSIIGVKVYRKENMLYVEIRDTGEPFPIHEYKPKALEEIIKRHQKGGLGIAIISKIMDDIEIEEFDDYFVYRFSKRI